MAIFKLSFNIRFMKSSRIMSRTWTSRHNICNISMCITNYLSINWIKTFPISKFFSIIFSYGKYRNMCTVYNTNNIWKTSNIKKKSCFTRWTTFPSGNVINCGFNDANAIHTFDTHLLTVGWEILKVSPTTIWNDPQTKYLKAVHSWSSSERAQLLLVKWVNSSLTRSLIKSMFSLVNLNQAWNSSSL